MLLQVWDKCLAFLANSNTHKITFLLSLSYTKRQVFFPSSAPSFFFSPSLSRTQWWTLYDGCPEALEWILSRTGLHPPVHFMLHIALVSTVWLWQKRRCLHPLPLLRKETEWFRVFPSLFTLSTLTYFFHFLSFSVIQNFPFDVIAPISENHLRGPVWSPNGWATHFLWLCLILAWFGW